jgi:hypothetical protein
MAPVEVKNMKFDDGIFGLYYRLYENRKNVEISLEDYLGKCSDDPSYYAGAAERMLAAIGGNSDFARLRRAYDLVERIALEELGFDVYSDVVDTSQDPPLGRIFMNRTIKVYPEVPIKLLHPLLRVEPGDEIDPHDETGLTPGDTIGTNDLVTVDPDESLQYFGVQVAHRNTRSRDGPQHRTSWSRDGPTVSA